MSIDLEKFTPNWKSPHDFSAISYLSPGYQLLTNKELVFYNINEHIGYLKEREKIMTTDTLFEYDHILMRTEYRTPDPHSHLAVHLILGLDSDVTCDVSGEHIEAPGIFIAADITHTAYTSSGGMLVYLFDPACLSQSRLSHLFKESVGISLHRYLAWEKMRKGYVNYRKYGSITEAAMRAGFDSPSHFAATCKRMFGLSFPMSSARFSMSR